MTITAERAFFIKLGDGGRWESECLDSRTLRFGYRHIPHELCKAGNWPAVEQAAREFRATQGAATSDVTQVRTFYEADERALWITFHADRLWWCRAEPEVFALPGNDKSRRAKDGWSDKDIHGQLLLKSKLSGRLLAVQKFRGTICTVRERAYLLHKINGTSEPHVAAAQAATENLQCALVPIIKSLNETDLEIFVDLLFRQGGWQRVGVSGGTERDIDLDLISPITNERIAVQVKSAADTSVLKKYRETFAGMQGFARFYFVMHTPDDRLRQEAADASDTDFVFWDEKHLARVAIRVGLTGWLLDKAS